ncbi:MAG: hypothetical protein LW636_00640, partial [Planctomycetaceae bacterium]|nr:hypothetical protein [Planctomycetaceae bacterium]
ACTAMSRAGGPIDLRLVPPASPVILGQTFDVKLRAQRTVSPTGTESFIAIDSIIKWNPQHLKLMGLSATAAPMWRQNWFIMLASPGRATGTIRRQDTRSVEQGLCAAKNHRFDSQTQRLTRPRTIACMRIRPIHG